VLGTEVVRPELLYHVKVPLLQEAVKVELCPEQIVVLLAETPVGPDGAVPNIDILSK
jgi:hypothetical protein